MAGFSNVFGQASGINFHDYDETNVIPDGEDMGMYTLVNANGGKYADISVRRVKIFPWLVAPTNYSGPDEEVWYLHHTRFNAENPECSQPHTQVAHRYIGKDGTVWEMGGQPDTECGDHTFNVYADVDNNLEPILIAPGEASGGINFYSEFWQAPTPYNTAPNGYPTEGFLSGNFVNYVFTRAEVVQAFSSYEVSAAGNTKTYQDVIKIFWLHDPKYFPEANGGSQFACGEATPEKYRFSNPLAGRGMVGLGLQP